MATRLTFLCAGATASSRAGGFPASDEPLDDGGQRQARAYRPRGPRPDIFVTSPNRAAIETAEAIGIGAVSEPMLADLGFGDWAGRGLADVETLDAPAFLKWLADPTEATPNGESMANLVARAGLWIDRHAVRDQVLLVVSHPAVLRAALSHTLAMPVASVMSVDIAPLTSVELSFHGRWRLQELRRAR